MTLPTDPRDDEARIPQQAGPTPPPPAAEAATTTPPRRSRRWLWIVAAVVVLLAVAGGAVYAFMPSEEGEAVERCQSAIKDKLFSPSTAVFAKDVKQNNKPPVYRISGELDAQNKFGGTVHGEYFCALRLKDDGGWETVDARTITR